MKNKPTISVVMSVYNGERYLREAIDSILGQTFEDFEFIIINDASTDGSDGIIKKYDDPRIVLVYNEKNRGLTKSLNIGLEKACGKYIARMDADDVSLPQRFTRQVDFLNDYQDHIAVGTFAHIIDAQGEFYREMPMPVTHEDVLIWLLQNCSIVHGSVMFRNGQDIRYDEEYVAAQDYELWVRLLGEGKMIANVPEVLYLWRNHASSVTSARFEMQSDLSRITADRHLNHIIRLKRYDYLLVASLLGIGLDEQKRMRILEAMKNWSHEICIDQLTMRKALYEYPISVSAVPKQVRELVARCGWFTIIKWLCLRYSGLIFQRLLNK